MNSAVYYSGRRLAVNRGNGQKTSVPLSSNLKLLLGTTLAMITATAASEVQTLTFSGSPVSGTFVIYYNGNPTTTLTIASSTLPTAAVVQAALQALPNVGAGNITVSLSGAVYTITWAGSLANLPQPLLVVTASLNTGSAAVARSTAGVPNGRYVAYDGTLVAAPTTAPTVAGNGSGSSFGAGTYLVSYTLATAAGESTPSPATAVTVTAAQNLRVSAISGLNAAVTSVKYYVDGVYVAATTPSSGTAAQTDLTGASITVGGTPPLTNTAFVNSDGRQIPSCFLMFDVVTDEFGQLSYGQQGSAQHGSAESYAPVYLSGIFNFSDLIGLDANGISALRGRFTRGNASTANSEIIIADAA